MKKSKTPMQEGYVAGLLKGHLAVNPYRIGGDAWHKVKQPEAFFQWNRGKLACAGRIIDSIFPG